MEPIAGGHFTSISSAFLAKVSRAKTQFAGQDCSVSPIEHRQPTRTAMAWRDGFVAYNKLIDMFLRRIVNAWNHESFKARRFETTTRAADGKLDKCAATTRLSARSIEGTLTFIAIDMHVKGKGNHLISGLVPGMRKHETERKNIMCKSLRKAQRE